MPPTVEEPKLGDDSPHCDDVPLFEPPPNWPLAEIRKVIPKHCFERSTARSLGYLLRDLAIGGGAMFLASHIDEMSTYAGASLPSGYAMLGPQVVLALKCIMWATYWWVQSLVFTGMWILAHECGHRAFSPSGFVSDLVGFTLHSGLITPYWSWKIAHHHHHQYHGSMEHDEFWIPDTRSELGIPETHDESVVAEYFSDSPLYCLAKLLATHFIAFQTYLLTNLSGQKRFPRGTSHYNPYAVIFKDSQRRSVIWSDIGVIAMLFILSRFNWRSAVPLYWVPWFGLSHWVVFITFLQHTDPVIPRYRDGAWSYVRGAAATVDRDFLGWQGKFFMHGSCHWHTVHHYFPKIPFYNGGEATEHLKAFMGKHYVYSDTPIFQTFWYNWNHCKFVEDKGTVLFLRDKKGRYARRVAEDKQS